MSNKFHTVFLILFFLPGMMTSQPGKGKLKLSEYTERSNQLKLRSSYGEAAKYLEKLVELEPQNTTLLFQLAETYRLARNSADASKYYGRVLKFSDESVYLNYPLILFHYGTVVMKNGHYAEAIALFKQFQKSYKGSKGSFYKSRARTLIESCEWSIRENHIRIDIEVELLDKVVNAGKTEYSPVLIQEDVLLFSSLRADDTENEFSSDMRSSIFTAQYSGEKWLKPVPFPGPFRVIDSHVGHGSFSPDKSRFYFTICPVVENNMPLCSVYYTQVEGNSWSDPVAIPTINIDGFRSTSPVVINDDLGTERIYFASNRPNGHGGMDIWYVIRDAAGNFTTAKNVGKPVNTEFNEVTPSFNAGEDHLFFSSDGHLGYGGFDIFKVPFKGNEFGGIRNLGKPVNSSQDDVYYVENPGGNSGFLVSNRQDISKVPSTCCDNIFSFNINAQAKRQTEFIIKGRVFGIDGQQTYELSDVMVQWYEVLAGGVRIWTDELNVFNSEPFEFVGQKDRSYEILFSKEGFESDSFYLDVSLVSSVDSLLEKNFYLKSEGVLVRGEVYGEDGQQKRLLPDVELKIYKIRHDFQDFVFLKSLSFDEEGFRTTLRPDDDYKLVFTRPGFLVGSMIIRSETLKKTGIPEYHLSLLEKQVGLKKVLEGVQFEASDIGLNAKSLQELDLIADFLHNNPGVEIEIGAFTDNFGSADFNRSLSLKRANAIIAYLMGKGIDPERLSAKGYGEASPIVENNSAENREKNRRIELKIVKINR